MSSSSAAAAAPNDPAQPPSAAAPPPAGAPGLFERVQAFRQKHAKAELVAFFAGGFLFDLLTLDRIDNVFTLVQQAVYLAVLAGLLLLEQRAALGHFRPAGFLGKAWRFHEDVVHFFFGSLLSSYTLFYFKSASGLSAIGFMVALVALLLVNELPRFRRLGAIIRFALFSLCLTSYFAYLFPVLVGVVRWWLFLVAVLAASGCTYGLYRLVSRWAATARADAPGALAPRISGPVKMLAVALAVQAAFFGLYLAHAIPPVPLSISYLGVFHKVQRAPGAAGYQLEHERPAWKLWHTGDQHFKARPGDRVYIFARIFAPRRFQDRVFIRWSFDDPKKGWVPFDRIPLTVVGGRDEGFAGYAYKQNWQPGDWRVEIQTEDGRDIGEIGLTVEADSSTAPRVFTVETR